MFFASVIRRWFNSPEASSGDSASSSPSLEEEPGEYMTGGDDYGLAQLTQVKSPVAE